MDLGRGQEVSDTTFCAPCILVYMGKGGYCDSMKEHDGIRRHDCI